MIKDPIYKVSERQGHWRLSMLITIRRILNHNYIDWGSYSKGEWGVMHLKMDQANFDQEDPQSQLQPIEDPITSVPALPWKMGTPSSFWDLRRAPFPRIFSAILPPFCLKTRRNQSLNIPLFSCKRMIFSEIWHPFRVKFTPFFKSNQMKLKLNIFILNRYGSHYSMR